jgi:hypothetical protein
MKMRLALLVLLLAATAESAEEVSGPVREAGFVGFVQAEDLPAAPMAALAGALARTISSDAATGRAAYEVDFPAGFRFERGPGVPQSFELFVLRGQLYFGSDVLQRYDFAFVPPGTDWPRLESSTGARALVFLDPASADMRVVEEQRKQGSYVAHFDEARWKDATVARDAGHALDLKVQDLKKDPFTTARTWLVRGGASLKVPWERHSVVEEGYLLEGDYRLPECLPGHVVIGNYTPGGYFRRPPDIVHSGPESGTKTIAVWLMRSPAALDVIFERPCEP